MTYQITVDPELHFGKPCIAGTRIPVRDVLELVREGIAFDSIVKDYYPNLTIEDIRGCVQYAMDVVDVEEIHVAPAGR
jgi:uncharacterized protein (DUF433 family)